MSTYTQHAKCSLDYLKLSYLGGAGNKEWFKVISKIPFPHNGILCRVCA